MQLLTRMKGTFFLAGLATGALALFLAHRVGESGSAGREVSTLLAEAVAPDTSQSLETLPRDAELPDQERAPGADPYVVWEEMRQRGNRLAEARRAEARDADTRRLLEAGFSQERIDWLRHRRDELLAQQEQMDFRDRQQGVPVSTFSFAVLDDRDLLLQSEMSDEEYMRYRRARGAPTVVDVGTVLPGSYAGQAGIKPGDQIVRYDNKRVFDNRVLSLYSLKEASVGSVAVEVLRDGQTFTVTLQKGPTGIGSPISSGPAALENFMNRRNRNN